MDMSGPNSIWVVPSEHTPGLVALIATPIVLWVAYCTLQALRAKRVAWAETAGQHLDRLNGTAKVALIGLWIGFIVHVVIVPTHWGDARVTAILFIGDALLFAAAAAWTFLARPHWKLVAVAISAGTAATYALYLLTGWETADPVGMVTTTIELASALVLLVPSMAAAPGLRARDVWLTVGSIPVALVSLLGVAAIAGTTTATAAASATATTSSTAASAASTSSSSSPSMPGMSMGGGATAPKATATALSLTTTSPAGAITWPYAMGAMSAGMQMVDASCTATPTLAQQEAAVALVDKTVAAVAPYKSLAAAKAAGYIPLTPTGQRQVHYINPSIYENQGDIPNPSEVPVLVYDNTAQGAVLVAGMYLMPPSGQTPPQPGGCLTQWHVHTDLCISGLKVVGTDDGAPCTGNSSNEVTPPMIHVWLVPDGGGPLSPEPSNAAVLAGARSQIPSTPNGMA
jgi:hypothetical protein